MIIKRARGQSQDIQALQNLLKRPDLASRLSNEIESEIRAIRAGEAGEREAAYEIDFHHGPSRYWAVIHDLRLEHEGRVAQIDHLLIGRFLDIWVCETKHFAEGVSIHEHGEFTGFFNRRPQAIASPIEQNRKHLLVLDKLLRSDKVSLPTRLGIPLRPQFHSVILISQKARITRPKAKVDGIDTILKSDQLRTLIERKIDEESFGSSLVSVGKLISSDALEAFAMQVARLHRPLRRDWAARFALGPEPEAAPIAEVDPHLPLDAKPSTAKTAMVNPKPGQDESVEVERLTIHVQTRRRHGLSECRCDLKTSERCGISRSSRW